MFNKFRVSVSMRKPNKYELSENISDYGSENSSKLDKPPRDMSAVKVIKSLEFKPAG